MLSYNEKINNCLKHRSGIQVPESELPLYITKALEQNKIIPNFVDTFGKKEIQCYVGFIDLKGFSNSVSGKNALEIHDFIYPFLNDIINILKNHHCLIDKTIGDEIMFVLPDMDENGGMPGMFNLSGVFCHLYEYAYNNVGKYQFRIAVSYGIHYLDKLGNDDYEEWAIFGEPIIVAKRLMSLEEMKNPEPIIYVIGLKDTVNKGTMPELLSLYGNGLWTLSNFKKIEPMKTELKGIGSVNYILWDTGRDKI
jgi:hypothetical protein